MTTYLAKTIAKTIGTGHFDPLSLTILAIAGGCALAEHMSKKNSSKKESEKR